MKRQDIPNIISVLRIVLIIPIVWTMLAGQFALALILFSIAGVSDAVDGFLAKHYHWESRLGSILDPIADKLLLISSIFTLTWVGLLPLWLLWLVLVRDIFIVVGGLAYHHILGEFSLKPLWSSKINTVLQISLVLWVVLDQISVIDMKQVITINQWLVVASIINSGSEYILVWGIQAWKQMRK
ncbi:MAG: CDP-alcohol phosphatidyltransferase [Methylophaga sp.]|nr:MAG: CDP-alcohol phosphatidyltransferase [Methylophaga sp.]